VHVDIFLISLPATDLAALPHLLRMLNIAASDRNIELVHKLVKAVMALNEVHQIPMLNDTVLTIPITM
jgi:hypothetical protein